MIALRDKALQALEEVAVQAEKAAVPKTLALRFILAFLANFAEERWPFDTFWHEATEPIPQPFCRSFGRHQSLQSALCGIYLQLGLKRKR